MICPSCGFVTEEASAGPCLRCGQPTAASTAEHSAFPSSAAPLGENFGFAYPGQSIAGGAPPTFVPPAPAPPRKKRTGLIVGITLGVVVLVASCLGISFTVLSALSQHALPFQDALTSNTNGWKEANGQCFFQDNSYHIENGYTCFAPVVQASDVNITVQARQLSGPLTQHYGIVFRHVDDNNWYEFILNSDTEWGFYKTLNGTEAAIVQDTINPAINGNLNSANTLRVQAKGSHFIFFVNGTQVGEAEDSAFASGRSGLFAGGYIEVAFNNFEITAA